MASPAASPDDSSHDALSSNHSASACSPSDSENLSPDELELLAKLEEQNRLLEADSKSLRSMNGSRRNSGSSLVSSSSASSNLSHLEEDTWILWGRIVNEWEDWRKRKEKLLKELIRKGIPHHFRAIVWQLLCSATDMPVKNQYSELLKMSSPCEKLIRRDIARTYPEHDFFKGQDSLGQEVLFNVMKAYSLVDREVGYCQGSAFIVGLLLMQRLTYAKEEEIFKGNVANGAPRIKDFNSVIDGEDNTVGGDTDNTADDDDTIDVKDLNVNDHSVNDYKAAVGDEPTVDEGHTFNIHDHTVNSITTGTLTVKH
ncbi:hypothetical protein NDU88_004609 [Pleurodeles waltl]|uniref:Rab-GAP TBC domain-containing protein n=1 Tax=Pleurodeles waltl TaxID=8319 RepID=A0AAV7T8E4_PLEWA|nr:hypothetical protein NDU88_004609 [Pleurodeles waltl]